MVPDIKLNTFNRAKLESLTIVNNVTTEFDLKSQDLQIITLFRLFILKRSMDETKFFKKECPEKHLTEKGHKSRPRNTFQCRYCDGFFRDKYNLKRHIKFVHDSESDAKQKNAKCPICEQFHHRNEILCHFKVDHQILVEEIKLEFQANNEFENWKVNVEKETKSRYVKVRNAYINKYGSKLISYHCHRDGFFKNSRGKNIRRIKVNGSNKINAHCPSKVVAKHNAEGKIFVSYVKTHVGHGPELNRVYLDKKEKQAIAEKLSMNVPFEQILDDIRDSIKDDDLKRLHLLSKQDLRNIVRDFKLKKKYLHIHDNDKLEVGLDKMNTEFPTFTRLYKPKFSTLMLPQLKTKDFLIIFMNDLQRKVLEIYGNRLICIDVTHGRFLQDLDMFSLYVLGDMQQVIPCVIWFSNRCDITMMQLVFSTIQDVIKKILKPKVLMTTDILHDAWCSVMGAPSSHIYCTWHVDREWRTNLEKIKNKEKRTIVYKQLKQLIEEKYIDNFIRAIHDTITFLQQDPNLTEFSAYFEKYKDSEKWAICHRQHFNENFFELENMHKALKYIYLKRQETEGIEEIIYNLMSFLRGKSLQVPMISTNEVLEQIKKYHRNAVNMSQASLIKINSTNWNVSGWNNEDIHHVEQVQEVCECELKCYPCGICIHLYVCSCSDSRLQWSMCTHIHLVSIVANHDRSTDSPVPLDGWEEDLTGMQEGSNQLDDRCPPRKEGTGGECALPLGPWDHIDRGLPIKQSEMPSGQEPIDAHCQPTDQLYLNPLVELKKKELLSRFTYLLGNATTLDQLNFINEQLGPCEQILGVDL